MSSNFLNNELKLQVKDIALEDSIDEEKAFARWVCDKILDISQDEIEDALKIQEAPEHNISIFHRDDEEEMFVIGRTIYDPTGSVTLSEREIVNLFDSIDRLRACDYRENQIFKEKSEDYVAYLTRNYRTQVIIAITGNLEIGVQKVISNKESLLVDSDVYFQVYTIKSLEDVVKDPRTQELAIKFKKDETFQRHGRVGNSITGTVDATEIVRIYEENRYRLFSLNPRESLKNTTVNKEILETLKDSTKREKFWQRNNGINATCDDFKESETEVGEFIFQNFKIVNGRQTTGSLYQASRKGWLDSSVQILLRVNATTNQEEREDISRATNTQNQIKWSDIISSRKEIKKLSLEISRLYPKFYYETQRGGYNNLDDAQKKSILKNGVIEKEKAVRCYISYNLERPYDAIQKSQEQIFRDGYKDNFENRLPTDFIIPHIFYEIITKLQKRWKKEGRTTLEMNIIRSGIGKYTVLAFIGDVTRTLTGENAKKFESNIINLFTNNKLEKIEKITETAVTQIAQALILEAGEKISTERPELIRKHLINATLIIDLLSKKASLLKTAGIADPIIDHLKNIIDHTD